MTRPESAELRRRRWTWRGALVGALAGTAPFWFMAAQILAGMRHATDEPEYNAAWTAIGLFSAFSMALPGIIIGAGIGAGAGYLAARMRFASADDSPT